MEKGWEKYKILEGDLTLLSVSEIKEILNLVYNHMDSVRKEFFELESYSRKLKNILNKKRSEFFNIKEGDIIEFNKSFRVGKYGFLNDDTVIIEINRITEKFIKGKVVKGDLVSFRSKSNKGYDYEYSKRFNVRKLDLLERVATSSSIGKVLDRDSSIDDILKN